MVGECSYSRDARISVMIGCAQPECVRPRAQQRKKTEQDSRVLDELDSRTLLRPRTAHSGLSVRLVVVSNVPAIKPADVDSFQFFVFFSGLRKRGGTKHLRLSCHWQSLSSFNDLLCQTAIPDGPGALCSRAFQLFFLISTPAQNSGNRQSRQTTNDY